MMRVAVLDDYQQVALGLADWKSLDPDATVQVFPDHLFDLDALARRLHAFECVVLMRERTPFPRALFERLPNLKLLITSGRRNAAIDEAAATDHGVQVCGTDLKGMGTAELTWGLILACLRHIVAEDRALQQGKWQTTLGIELAGKSLGLLGLGRLGSEVARVGAVFRMNPIAWSPNLTAERAAAAGARLVSKEELLAQADVLTIHMVLSDRTRGLVGAADLARVKKTAFLINTSRGPIVDEDALAETLRAHRIAGAGLDVFSVEPLPRDSPFRKLDNVVITPHLGYVSVENYAHHFPQVVEIIRGFIAGTVLKGINQVPKAP
ncbi:MAG TPA: D-2-hydroxyacid dehydrogenase family protein [Stellaceae bacterium]|jgi:phosphoglycerate dehydrogenase-like enzyme|nr:D-2-hydroxyacid dehydrogenase family protein [Stellaceae bacterium]